MALKKKIYLAISIWLVFFLLFILLFLIPLGKKMKANSQKIIELKNEKTILAKELNDILEFKKNYSKSEEIEKIKALFVDAQVPVEFISFLENLAQKAKISLEISALPSQTLKGQSTLFFSLRGQALFSNMAKFISLLEKSPYLVQVESFQITKEQEQKLSLLNFSLTLKVYAKSQP